MKVSVHRGHLVAPAYVASLELEEGSSHGLIRPIQWIRCGKGDIESIAIEDALERMNLKE